VRTQGLHRLAWLALVVLVLGLIVGAVLLAPWRLKFAVDARDLYDYFYDDAASEASAETLGWLARCRFPLSGAPAGEPATGQTSCRGSQACSER